MELNLKDFRKSIGYSQEKLAEVCGVSRQTIINWEKNPDNIPYASAQFLMSLADGASTGDNPTPDGSIPLILVEVMAGYMNGEQNVQPYEYIMYQLPSFSDCDFLVTVLDYMTALAAKKNASARKFQWLVPFIRRYKPETRLTAVDKDYVKGLIEAMRDMPSRKFSDSRKLSPNTVSIYFKAFSHAMSIAVRGDIIPSNPCDNLALWVENSGIKKHITFHCARHTFATMSISAGVDLFAVSKLLGHTDVKTTQIYAKMMDERKTEAVDALAGFYERKEGGP